MKALETTYREIKYRSRTEARWAVFFDEIRVPYSYEPEGFDLDGDWYLPDFWLPAPGVWFEVKGIAPNEREVRVAKTLSRVSRCPVLIAVGQPGDCYNLLTFQNGQQGPDAAFVGDMKDLFIGSQCQNLQLTIRGNYANLGGVPDPLVKPARIAAAMRFGVHD